MDLLSTESKKLKIMASSSSPCAACKFLRRKCTQECVFAPYFPPDNPQKFANVHKVFGASNVSKLLNELSKPQREDAVNSLAFEAEYRLRDPVYGCVGLISVLQHKLSHIKSELGIARKELSGYIGPSALLPMNQHPGMLPHQINNNPSSSMLMQYNVQPMLGMGMPTGVPHGGAPQLIIRDPQQQQYIEAQQQELIRSYEHQQQQQQEIERFNNNGYGPSGVVTATGLNQMNPSTNVMQTSLALGGFENNNYDQIHPHQQQQDGQEQQHSQHLAQHQTQLMLNQQLQQDHQQQQPQQMQTISSTHQEQQDRLKCEDRLGAGGPS
ncbi:hypothetical protein Leryth_013657 [Lithospermum erythrorhizon]|nr:hypothetical protein Leryth_013657 [Lithospermum erythrorhizon]